MNSHAGPAVEFTSGTPSIEIIGKNILIVEDEALVAISLRNSLDELGYSVIGPCNRISEAMIALRHNHIDAAVLDVNLGGDLVYSLADVLTSEEIPFVFLTGYGPEEIESRFSAVPVLQKPIEQHALQKLFSRPQP